MIAHYWHFDMTELLLQTLLNLLFCGSIFYYSIHHFKYLFKKGAAAKKLVYLLVNLLILAAFTLVGITVQRALFKITLLPGGGVMLRLIASLVLIFIELRILHLVEETKNKELENEHLRNENLSAGMQLLKAQLNPHFFFNALSSLSAIVRENPPQAQRYINHLSKVFRYSLHDTTNNFVPLKEELAAIQSYAELMKMRHEQGFELKINIDEEWYELQLPHLSLQPLVENAVKHNTVSISHPLIITIGMEADFLVVSNNLQPVIFAEAGENIGLVNLNERYKLLIKKEIGISKTEKNFIVKLPLQ